MSYAAFYKLPSAVQPSASKLGLFVAGWAYILLTDSPPPGRREIAMDEWNATPAKYLKHPDLHPERLTQFPGSKRIPNAREELMTKHNYPQEHHFPHGHGHGHH